jgi:hypothetical protein
MLYMQCVICCRSFSSLGLTVKLLKVCIDTQTVDLTGMSISIL